MNSILLHFCMYLVACDIIHQKSPCSCVQLDGLYYIHQSMQVSHNLISEYAPAQKKPSCSLRIPFPPPALGSHQYFLSYRFADSGHFILMGSYTICSFCDWLLFLSILFSRFIHTVACKVYSGGSDGKESTCSAGDLGSMPGLGRSPGGGHGSPLQSSCLENPMDRGAWRATVCGVAELDTTERLSTHSIQQSFTAFNDWIIVHCGYAVSAIQSSVDGRLDCFHILTGINDATVNIQAHDFVQMSCSHFSCL